MFHQKLFDAYFIDLGFQVSFKLKKYLSDKKKSGCTIEIDTKTIKLNSESIVNYFMIWLILICFVILIVYNLF